MTVHEPGGAEVAKIEVRDGKAGVNRVVWDMRYADGGPFVHVGRYELRVVAAGQTATGSLEVREDPRITVAAEVRRAWVESLRGLHRLRQDTRALNQQAQAALRGLPANAPAAQRAAAAERLRETTELASRVQRLYGDAQGEVGPLSGLQREEEAYYRRMLAELSGGAARAP